MDAFCNGGYIACGDLLDFNVSTDFALCGGAERSNGQQDGQDNVFIESVQGFYAHMKNLVLPQKSVISSSTSPTISITQSMRGTIPNIPPKVNV